MIFTESLKENYQFRRLYRRGKSEAGPFVAVYCLKNGKDINRLGITTGGKLGKAVIRNRIRRRIMEAYRLSENRMRRGYDIVVVARGRSVAATYHQIESDLHKCLHNLGIMREVL
ncbi:MAG: ribonuclease P protein component [Eubacteriales bacterium]|jgi:ribonuclease P protein component